MSQGLFPRIKGANSDYFFDPHPEVKSVVSRAQLTVPALADLKLELPEQTTDPKMPDEAWKAQWEERCVALTQRLETLRTKSYSEPELMENLQQAIKDTLGPDQLPIMSKLLQHAEKTYPADHPLFLKIYLCPYGQPSTVDQVPDAQTPHCAGVNATCPADVDPREGHAMVLLHQTEGIKLVAGTDNVLAVDQAGTITLAPTRQAEVQAPLLVTGETTVASTLTVAQQATLQAGLSVAEQSTLNAGLSVAGPTALAQTLTVTRQTTLNDGLVVAGPATCQDSFSVAGPTELAQTLTVTRQATFNDSLVVAGSSTLKAGLTVEGQTVVNGVSTSQVLLRLVPDGLALQVNGATMTIDANGAIHLTPRQDSKVYLSGDLEVTGVVMLPLSQDAHDTTLTSLRTELVRLKQALDSLSTRIPGR
jgi:hypothetical protein